MYMYDNDLESLYSARILTIYTGKKKEFLATESTILCVVTGSLYLTSGEHERSCVEKNQMIFIHPGFPFILTARERTRVLVIMFPEIIPLCNRYIPEVLEQKKYTCETLFYPLEVKKYIGRWFDSLQILASELRDHHSLVQAKMQEFFLLLKISYSRDQLSYFLCPVFSYNYDFTLFILNNYYKVKTVSELAELSAFSLSGFEKEFRKVFGTSPYQWMLKKKRKKLYYEISATEKVFKVIAEEYGFVSLSQLGDFCRKHFGASPRDIRQKKEK
ncbi:MAG: AraC family transcriptional regulator [Tannerellaceae bacterium]|nr:AraC family transcriptional regulator [Tannerellaceae bacterium]